MSPEQMARVRVGQLLYRLIPLPDGDTQPYFIQEYRVSAVLGGAAVYLRKFADQGALPVKVTLDKPNAYEASPGEACAAALMAQENAVIRLKGDVAVAEKRQHILEALLADFQAGKVHVERAPAAGRPWLRERCRVMVTVESDQLGGRGEAQLMACGAQFFEDGVCKGSGRHVHPEARLAQR